VEKKNHNFVIDDILFKKKSNNLPKQLGQRSMKRKDHGLRMPNKAFFHKNPKLLGLSRQCGQINFEAFGVFSADLSAPILVLLVPCPCFPSINHYFYEKLSLYIQITNTYLGLGFEFGMQKIRDLAIMCPKSEVKTNLEF
jgi:hypothetical protein